jgi:uncharacterized membrane protein YkoI
MKNRGYGERKRRDFMKTKEVLCYNCDSPDHAVAKCPYENKRYHIGELKLKKNKKENKEKKSFTINNKKKGGSYVVTWDSDDSDDDDDDDDDDDESSSDDEKPIRRAFASIALTNKPSLFDYIDTPYGQTH